MEERIQEVIELKDGFEGIILNDDKDAILLGVQGWVHRDLIREVKDCIRYKERTPWEEREKINSEFFTILDKSGNKEKAEGDIGGLLERHGLEMTAQLKGAIDRFYAFVEQRDFQDIKGKHVVTLPISDER